MTDFKEWELTMKVKLVSTSNIDSQYLRDIIWAQLQESAGRCGYLMGQLETNLKQVKGKKDDES